MINKCVATRRKRESEEQVQLLEYEQQPVHAHIYFRWQYIKVGPRTSLDKLTMRRVYMECWKDPTNEEKQAILDLKIGVTDTLTVHCEAETHHVKYNRGKWSICLPT